MHIGKSVKKALIDVDQNGVWLAEQLGSSPSAIYNLFTKKTCSCNMLERLSVIFGIKVSELIALGE